jgi:hypothetical protein
MRVESGTTTGPGVVITDEAASESGAAGAFAGTANAMNFAGSIGTFSLVVTTGTSTPFLAAPGFYEAIDLSNISITAAGAGTLRIILERTDFGSLTPDGLLEFRSEVGGVLTAAAGSSITFNSYADDANAVPDLGADVNPVGALASVTGIGAGSPASITQSFGPGAFSGANGVDFSKSGTYSIYTVVTITFTSAGSVSFNQIVGTAPAPGGLVLALTAVPGLALGYWRRLRRRAMDA